MTAWRFRRCPECEVVLAAGEFRPVGTYRPGWRDPGTIERECPECGHRAETQEFVIVRERRAGQGAPSRRGP